MFRVLFLAVGTAFLGASAVRAGAKDPLRFFPAAHTDVVIKIEKPRALVESIVKHELSAQFQAIPQVREVLDSPDVRKFFQLIAYYERDLGAAWPDLLDKLAGGGIALGLKFAEADPPALLVIGGTALGLKSGEGDPPALLVIQGTDEATVSKFLELAAVVVEDEVVRQGGKNGIEKRKYHGVECWNLGKEAHVARIGDAILLSTKREALKAGIDQHFAKKGSLADDAGPKAAAAILPPNPVASVWVNFKPFKQTQKAKDLFAIPRNDLVQTIILAGIYDAARRSDFVAAGLYHDAGNFQFTIRLPAGRENMGTDAELHLPRDLAVGGTLPLLEPKGVLFSHSFYFDFDTLYKKREAIMPMKVAKDFAEGEKQVSRFLLGTSLPKFLSESGVYHRIVAVQPERVPEYKTEPGQRLPAAAFVTSMRDPAFAKSVTMLIKAGAFAFAGQASLTPWEGEIAGVPAFGYSFPEKGKFPDDPTNSRFNYQPTFAAVKDQYIFASNRGLCRDLIESIQKGERATAVSPNMQLQLNAKSLGDYANLAPDQALAAAILAQGLPVGQARKQTEALLGFAQKLGTVRLSTDYSAKDFRFELTWKTRDQ